MGTANGALSDDSQPSRTVRLSPNQNRTHHYWHTFVPGLKAGQIYAYRAHDSTELTPHQGFRFDSDKVLLDPYGRGVAVPAHYRREAASRPGDNTSQAMKSMVIDIGRHPIYGVHQVYLECKNYVRADVSKYV